ncbi:MAG: DUF1667 domain-containing protein [Candidatus Altiarchaeota archaeon]
MKCIVCPVGCDVTVEYVRKKVREISGCACQRGEAYARDEVVDPKRVLTSTVRVSGGSEPLVSVRTDKAIQKVKVKAAVKKLSKLKVRAPVKIGDVLVRNLMNSGADVVSTKTVPRR